ncbi:hypothetical protein MMC10_009431 [Thelotrema lepadinum]|nr:hypothetical protein [Thelotrema lepadinum]
MPKKKSFPEFKRCTEPRLSLEHSSDCEMEEMVQSSLHLWRIFCKIHPDLMRAAPELASERVEAIGLCRHFGRYLGDSTLLRINSQYYLWQSQRTRRRRDIEYEYEYITLIKEPKSLSGITEALQPGGTMALQRFYGLKQDDSFELRKEDIEAECSLYGMILTNRSRG